MDSFHYQQQQQQHERRMLGQTIAGGGGDYQWYTSSSPPPPPPGGYFNHPPPPQQPHGYPNHHHPPHVHQQQHPMGMGPPPHPRAPAPPYHGQSQPAPPPPYPHHSQYPPPTLPPRPHHSMPMPHHPPPPSAYHPPLNQAGGNPYWAPHQGWEFSERNVPYNNEEDWAARAKAWAAAKSGTENHHTHSHFTPVGRTDEHGYPYHDQYQQAVVPLRDVQQPSFPQSSNQHFPGGTMDPLRQVNHLHGSTSFSSGSFSYSTGYNAGDEATKTNADHIASPQKSYGTGSSAYEQEVSYSYSSAPAGDREVVHRIEGLHDPLPLPVSSVQEGHHSQSTLPAQMTPSEKPHFSNHMAPADFLPDACDRPLEFERRHDSIHQSHQKINYGHTGPAVAVGVMEHDPASSSLSWTPTASGVGFPQIPLGPSGAQFDPAVIPQASVPVPSPVFGGIMAPSFQPGMPPVNASYALGPASSLHAAAFSGDLNSALNLTERPKKAAVPNWLREEIIKNKSVLPSAVSTQPTGDSFDSVGPEYGDKSIKRDDHGDSKSIDSTRSAEDEEDEEEDVEATKLAAINQEIKRVLTEVLLKVTDELFDEIATKVLNEEEQSVGVADEPTTNGNQRVSPSTAIPTAEAAAKVLVPLKMEANKVDHVGENSSTSSPGGNVLGLANYASDDDDGDNDEMQSTKLLSSGKKTSTSHKQESDGNPSDNDSESVKDEAENRGIVSKHGALGREENHIMKKSSLSVDNLYYPDRESEGVSTVHEESLPVDSRKVDELPSESAIFKQSMGIVSAEDNNMQESTSGYAKNDKALANDNRDREARRDTSNNKNSQNKIDHKISTEKTHRETSDGSDSLIHEDKDRIKEKMDKREKLERVDDRSSMRRVNMKESDSRRSFKHNSVRDDKEATKEKREKYKDVEMKRERTRDEKENRSASGTKDSSRYSRRSPSPSGKGKNIKDNFFQHGSASGDQPSDNPRKRKKIPRNNSLSPSPTKSRKRQVSRSPPSKHSHRRHSPYSSEKRRRSRSISPGHRSSAARKRGS